MAKDCKLLEIDKKITTTEKPKQVYAYILITGLIYVCANSWNLPLSFIHLVGFQELTSQSERALHGTLHRLNL